MTKYTAQWLYNRVWTRDGKLEKDSYKKDLRDIYTEDQLKAFVWRKMKPLVRNMESFKKGQATVNYKLLFEMIDNNRKELL